MDPLGGIAAVTLAIVPLFFENIKNPGLLSDLITHHILDVWSESDTVEEKRKKIYAKLRNFFLHSFFSGVWHQWNLIEKTLLPGDDQTVEKFRLAYISKCNLTAVAGAIIAQVAITGLSLPQISQTHWVVRACFIVSLISGCFAVYLAYWSQKTIGTTFRASKLKDWLTRCESVPLSGWQIRRKLTQLNRLKNEGDETQATFTNQSIGDVEQGLLKDFNNLKEWQRSASLWSAFLLQVPFTYMKLSLGSFIIGLSIYLGFIWTHDLDQQAGKNDSRNIFIVLLVVVLACIYSYVAPALYKSLEVFPVHSWKEYQEELKNFAEAQRRMFPQDMQQSIQSDPSSKDSMRKQSNAFSNAPTSGMDEISNSKGSVRKQSNAFNNIPASGTDELFTSNGSMRKQSNAFNKAPASGTDELFSSKGSMRKQSNAFNKAPMSGMDEMSSLINPANHNAIVEMLLISSAANAHIAEMSSALRAATSTQMSTNVLIQNLTAEIANLTASLQGQG